MKNNTKECELNVYSCPVSACLKIIGGKWKPIIIFLITKKINRFGALSRSIPGISKQALTTQLRELEKDDILKRTIYEIMPPRIEYTLTKNGLKILPIIKSMAKWGQAKLKE